MNYYDHQIRSQSTLKRLKIKRKAFNQCIILLRLLKRSFRLLHSKSTTPDELFQSKVDAEEYGEALQLAKSYNLDTDLVYQKQWRSKPMTKSTIIDYLVF